MKSYTVATSLIYYKVHYSVHMQQTGNNFTYKDCDNFLEGYASLVWTSLIPMIYVFHKKYSVISGLLH